MGTINIMDYVLVGLSVLLGMFLWETVIQLARVFREKNMNFQLKSVVDVINPSPPPEPDKPVDIWESVKND